MNHMLGSYIAIGVNDAESYPLKPYLSDDKPEDGMSDEAMELEAQRIAKMFGGEIK